VVFSSYALVPWSTLPGISELVGSAKIMATRKHIGWLTCIRIGRGGVKCVYSIQPPTRSLLHSRTNKHVAVLKSDNKVDSMEVSIINLRTLALMKNSNICHSLLPADHLLPQRHKHHSDFIYTAFNRYRKVVEDAYNTYCE
jgi:hypothetical protein